MMSSEEEADCFGLYGDKLLKKAKRARQRVDAGEPRNSYSSIPNFSSRPSFLSGGLYGAFLSQTQHFSLLGQGYGPGKMLNELLGRQVKQATDAATPTDTMITMDPAGSEGAVNFECLNSGPVIRRGLEEDGSPPPGDMTHHMLRDILQGRKKELLALEQELRGVPTGNDPHSPDNNNSINNNNNEVKTNIINGGEVNHTETNGTDLKPVVNGVLDIDNASGGEEGNVDEVMSDDGKPRDDEGNNSGHASDSERSVVSPASDSGMKNIKEEPEEGKDSGQKTEQIELKRARVENIVSSMRSSPSLPSQVNGCKKRKLYHPQQHDSAAERYSGMNMNMGMFIDDDTVDNNSFDNNEIRQKKVEKDALKTQLRSMQEQLAEMQQKYVQLCTRMDQDSECQNEDDGSDIDQDNNSLSLPDKPIKTPPATSQLKEVSPNTAQVSTPTQSTITPTISKIISAKLQPPHMNNQQMPIPPTFNGALSLLQQQVLQDQHSIGHPYSHHHHHPQMQHHALSNAAAMYLGLNSHKLFIEQEARLNKEAAIAAEQQHQHQQHLSQHHQHHNQQNQTQAQNQQQTHATQNITTSQHSQTSQTVQTNQQSPTQNKTSELSERLSMLRNNGMPPTPGPDLEGLADVLKTEITSSLGNLIDSIMSRFVQQKRGFKPAEAVADQLNKDLVLASQLLDRRSPRTKVIDRGNGNERTPGSNSQVNGVSTPTGTPRINGTVFPSMNTPHHQANNNPENNINTMNIPHVRPSPNTSMFQPPKPPTSISSSAAALYSSMSGLSHSFCKSEPREGAPEQNEALSLVVAPKKKRHKVTDTRITPRTVSRILAQDGMVPPNNIEQGKFTNVIPSTSGSTSDSPPPRPYHPPPPMLPVSLPTSVAIPNPSLHESQVFSPYSPFYHQSHPHMSSGSPPEMKRESPPLPHPPSLLHPALLAAAQHGTSPDYSNMRVNPGNDNMDRSSDCNSGDGPYDGITPTSSTLTPMHLRKAKLMFFWVRYPSSAVLKMYFPDIKFNKNNTAQLVKWFSNFREFYYIQMEKYARQAVSEGIKSSDDLHVSGDCEIYRVLNLHYNRNNHIEVPPNFRYVVEQTLKEFFKAIQGGKDTEQSWKKSIYKIISRLDDPVPEYFKSPNFLEQLE
ncbi:homeobox protein prospero isoform X2 [Halyomorpha halys]|uniref:homeobox protein prospero isoform X2 n=1 Tax=Halyomorpha halys TaxID=286706 RepID=UPI0006D4E247|nr:homeobox protein prospero isoform X2 [Halyomorpha halys]